MTFGVDSPLDAAVVPDLSDIRPLFHRLNNQLGIILAHAELLETKALDETSRARAAQVVASALDAMMTAREMRSLAEREA